MKRVTAVALLLCCVHCATSYQRKGFGGGYEDVQVDGNTFIVEVSGNGYTSRATIAMYLQYRCAELTLERGFDYYVVQTEAAGGTVSLAQAPGGGGFSVEHLNESARIRLFKGRTPSDPNAFDAREVVSYLKNKI